MLISGILFKLFLIQYSVEISNKICLSSILGVRDAKMAVLIEGITYRLAAG
jgi:hypothetical protein